MIMEIRWVQIQYGEGGGENVYHWLLMANFFPYMVCNISMFKVQITQSWMCSFFFFMTGVGVN